MGVGSPAWAASRWKTTGVDPLQRLASQPAQYTGTRTVSPGASTPGVAPLARNWSELVKPAGTALFQMPETTRDASSVRNAAWLVPWTADSRRSGAGIGAL